MKKNLVKLNILAVLLLLLSAHLVLAQGLGNSPLIPSQQPGGTYGVPADNVETVLLDIINIVLAFVALVAVGFLIVGGFRYITSAGDSEITEAAKKTIYNSIIGLIVVILSYVIVVVIINQLSA